MIKKADTQAFAHPSGQEVILLDVNEIQTGLTESLTGRFELIKVPHWSYRHTKALTGMSLDDFLVYGGYPGSYKFIDDFERWQSYLTESIITNVISNDILQFRSVKKPALFKQAFDLNIM